MRHALTLAALLPLTAAGCRAEPAMIQVEGTVSYRGKPLTNGFVNFEPTDPARGNDAASALIGPDGRYRLRTRKPNDGITPGTYRVAIRSDGDPATGASAIPPEYESADRSPLTAEVAPAPEKQTIDFTLNDPRPGTKSLPRLPK